VTSQISKEDIEDLLFDSGVKNVTTRNYVMRQIELYARKYPVPADMPVNVADFTGYKYLCRDCGDRKAIGDFPEYKKENRRAVIPCNECWEKRTNGTQGRAEEEEGSVLEKKEKVEA
jgi:hypothetical protein